MKLNKIILLFLAFIVVSFIIAYIFFGYPLVFNFSQDNGKATIEPHKKGDIIRPFDKFDFNNGNWSAYIFIAKDDMSDLSKEMPRWHCFKTTDINLLKQMKTSCKFIYTEGDMATVESMFTLCKDGKQVFNSEIELDESNQGLQSEEYGWLEPYPEKILLNYCKQFHKVYFPIVILK